MTQTTVQTPLASQMFDTLRGVEALRPPDARRIANSDETRLLGPAEGVVEWTSAPTPTPEFGDPPTEARHRTDPDRRTRLWVVLPSRVPTVLEYHPYAQQLASKRMTHTNLTGGDDAHCGGELWVKDATTLYLSGASGRYTPSSAQVLAAAANAFRSAGYRVGSLGWDGDYPRRIMREEDVQWE